MDQGRTAKDAMFPEARRASLWIGTLLVGIGAALLTAAVLSIGLLGCVMGSCQPGAELALPIGGAVVFGATLVAARAAERRKPWGRPVVAAIGLLLLAYATFVAILRWQGSVPSMGAGAILLGYAAFAGALFLVVTLGAGLALVLACWPDRGPLRVAVVVPIMLAAGAGLLALIGPSPRDWAARPETPADQVLGVRVAASAIELEPDRLAAGSVDLELRGSPLGSRETLFLIGPVTQGDVDALAAGDIDWRGDYFDATFDPEPSDAVVAESFSWPATGYLGRFELVAGRDVLFTTTERTTIIDERTSQIELVPGPWMVLAVE
jgi:hypothetical protein